MKDAQVYATLTGIIMSGGVKEVGAEVGSIDKRAFDMEKVAKVNELSRAYAAKKLISTNSVTTLSTLMTWWPRSRYGFKRWGPDWSAERWSLCFKTTCLILDYVYRRHVRLGSLLFLNIYIQIRF